MGEYKEFFQFLASLGVGGVLAAFIFITYHRTMVKQADDNKGREELLMSIVTANTAAMTKNTASLEANIAVTNQLRTDLVTLTTLLHDRRGGGR